MAELSPFLFDNFVEGGETPVLDLDVNRRRNENGLDGQKAVLAEINAGLKLLLEDQNRRNLRFVEMVLAEIAPSLAEKCGSEVIKDYLSRRFPELGEYKKIAIYLHPDNVEPVRALLEEMAVRNGYEGRIKLYRDDKVSLSGCRVVWEDGEERFSTEQILDKIREQLNGVIGNDRN